MPQNLDHQRIVITGGFGVLGQAIGRAAAAAGAHICLIGHGAAPTDATTLPAAAVCIGNVDLTDSAAALAALQQAGAALGGVDALVNVAGGFQWQTLTGDAFDAWDRMYAMNLKTAVLATLPPCPGCVPSRRRAL